MSTIIWTRTDEAPLLATYSFKPVVEAFASAAGINVETRDISLAARILGKMGHPERFRDGLMRNIPGIEEQNIFANAVNYCRAK